MNDEELKNKCKERAKIFQQAMESCKSSNPIDCIEWFADRIEELEKENAELKDKLTAIRNAKDKYDMSKDKSIINSFGAEYTLFCGLERILEDWQEDDQLTKAKEIIKCLLDLLHNEAYRTRCYEEMQQAEQFLEKVK